MYVRVYLFYLSDTRLRIDARVGTFECNNSPSLRMHSRLVLARYISAAAKLIHPSIRVRESALLHRNNDNLLAKHDPRSRKRVWLAFAKRYVDATSVRILEEGSVGNEDPLERKEEKVKRKGRRRGERADLRRNGMHNITERTGP